MSGSSLYSEAFSLKPPTDRQARLRFSKYAEGSESWKNAHTGAGQFGVGRARRIRNLYVHEDVEVDVEALECLAALSLPARWIDSASVDSI